LRWSEAKRSMATAKAGPASRWFRTSSRGTQPTPRAEKGDQQVTATLDAEGRGKAVGKDAALQVSSQLPLHVGRHRVSVPVAFRCQREVGPQVLLDEAVEDGLLGAATGVRGGSTSLWVGGHVGSAA
jgi:hypothetical protein